MLLLLLLALLLVLFFLFVYRSLTAWPRLGIPHITPSFPFGNFTGVFAQSQSFANLIRDLYNDESAASKQFVGIYSGLRATLLIRDPEMANEILTSDSTHFRDRGLYVDEKNDPLSGNLVAMSGARWKRLRKKLVPAFTPAKIRAMFGCMVSGGTSLEWKLNESGASDNVLEMHEIAAQFTTNAIASVAFGLDIDCIREPEILFRKMGRKIFEPSVINGIRDAAGFLFPSLQHWLPFKSVDQDVEDFFMSIVRQNLKHRSQEGIERADFFQELVKLWHQPQPNDGLTDVECAAQAFIFYVAGFETSSTTMSFTLFELARNQDCQLLVQQDIDQALEACGGKLCYEAVMKMKYLDSCIRETLRKYPPLPFLNREFFSQSFLPGTKIILDKGTPVIIPIHAIQNDPIHYPNPTQFDPTRFTDFETINRKIYLPFGAGPRNCIGQRLGRLQTKVGLVMLLRGHRFDLAGNTASGNELKMCTQNVLLCSVGGIQLKVNKR